MAMAVEAPHPAPGDLREAESRCLALRHRLLHSSLAPSSDASTPRSVFCPVTPPPSPSPLMSATSNPSSVSSSIPPSTASPSYPSTSPSLPPRLPSTPSCPRLSFGTSDGSPNKRTHNIKEQDCVWHRRSLAGTNLDC